MFVIKPHLFVHLFFHVPVPREIVALVCIGSPLLHLVVQLLAFAELWSQDAPFNCQRKGLVHGHTHTGIVVPTRNVPLLSPS